MGFPNKQIGSSQEAGLLSYIIKQLDFISKKPSGGSGGGLTDAQLRATPVVIEGSDSMEALQTIYPADIINTYTGSGVIVINTILLSTNNQFINFFTFSVNSLGTTGVITPEFSNDNGVTWFTATIYTLAGVPITTVNTTGIFTVPALAQNFRLRLSTATTAGNTNVTLTQKSAPIGFFPSLATQPVSFPALPAGTNNIGDVDVLTLPALPAGTNLAADFGTQYRANATGAASRTQVISAGTTNATIVKGSAGRLLGWSVSNTNAAWRYVKLHNQSTSPTAGTGVVQTIAVPPNSTVNYSQEGGIAFTTGIGMTTVTGAALTDTTAVGLNDLIINLFFA